MPPNRLPQTELLATCFCALSTPLLSQTIDALIVTGGNIHAYDAQQNIIRAQIDLYTNLDVNWTVEGTSVFNDADWSEGYDIVIHNLNANGNANTINRTLEPHKAGLPAMLFHATTISYGGNSRLPDVPVDESWTEWSKFTGVQTGGHGAKPAFDMKFIEPDHEILHGMSEWTTPPNDEMYEIRRSRSTITPLIYAAHPDDDYRINTWINNYGPDEGPHETRVFVTTLGHGNAMYLEPNFAEMFARAFIWATGNSVEDNLATDLPILYEFEDYDPAVSYSPPDNSFSAVDSGGFGRISWFDNGHWLGYQNINFGSGTDRISLRFASTNNNGQFEIRRDSVDGPTLATVNTQSTGDNWMYQTHHYSIPHTEGIHDLYFVATNSNNIALLDFFYLDIPADTGPVPTTIAWISPPPLPPALATDSYYSGVFEMETFIDQGGAPYPINVSISNGPPWLNLFQNETQFWFTGNPPLDEAGQTTAVTLSANSNEVSDIIATEIRVLDASGAERHWEPYAIDNDTVGLWHMVSSDFTPQGGEIEEINGSAYGETSGYDYTSNSELGGLILTQNDIYGSIAVSHLGLNTDPSFSIEAWVQFTELNPTDNLSQVLFNTMTGNEGFRLERVSDGRWKAEIRNGNANDRFIAWTPPEQPINIQADTWHHIAMTWNADTDTLKLWIDGAEVANETFDSVAHTSPPAMLQNSIQPLHLGTDKNNTASRRFHGLMDTVRLSSVARTYQPAPGDTTSLDPAYSAWEQAYDLTLGRDGDDDGDGFLNRFEYIFGMNPTSYSTSAIDSVQVVSNRPSFSFSRRPPSSDLVYSIQVSGNLIEWIDLSEGAGTEQYSITGGPVLNSDGSETLTIRYNTHLEEADTSLFFRVVSEE